MQRAKRIASLEKTARMMRFLVHQPILLACSPQRSYRSRDSNFSARSMSRT